MVTLACAAPKTDKPLNTYVEFCAPAKAANLICTDDSEYFFDHINALDISIQMQTENPFKDQISAVNAYKGFLKNQLLGFSNEEIDYLTRIMENCLRQINEINPGILPDSIHLIKTDGTGYGRGVFYTRENAIIIPMDELGNDQNGDKIDHLESIMYHELFHIISRNNQELKKQLYKEIGFQKLESKLTVPSVLQSRKLLNPDGIDIAYFISLTKPNTQETKLAIPIIRSKQASFNKERPLFFSYIDFDLYEITQIGESSYEVLCDETGASLLENEFKASFFKQIGDNTDYIIHPDEIMADNFTFCMRKEDMDSSNSFSDSGQQLIKKVRAILSTIY
jgi:hypothetical protein